MFVFEQFTIQLDINFALQEKVRRINENLPMYFLHSVWRTRYEGNFYPKLQTADLYKLLKVKKYGVKNLNPKLAEIATEPVSSHVTKNIYIF